MRVLVRLPFLHQTAIGVHLTETRITWVELVRSVRRLRVVRHEAVAVEPGGAEEAVRTLVERLGAEGTRVAAHIDSSRVRHHILEVPESELGTLERWVQAQVQQVLPPRVGAEGFVVRHSLLQRSEAGAQCLIALARRTVVEEQIRLCERVGLRLSLLSTTPASIGHAFSFDRSFIESRARVVLDEGHRAQRIDYEGGLPVSICSIGTRAACGGKQLQRGDAHEGGSGAAEQEEAARFLIVSGEPRPTEDLTDAAEMARPLHPILPESESLPASAAPAAALALGQLYPALPSIDFLEEAAVVEARREREKRDTLRLALGLSAPLLFLLLGLTLANAHLYAGQEAAIAALHRTAPQRARVARARAELDQLKVAQAEAQRLLGTRTRTAGLLEAVGQMVPPQSWLQRLHFEASDGRSTLTLAGLSLEASATAVLLDDLERSASFREVKLRYTEADQPGRSAPTRRRSKLRRFEIAAEVVALTPFNPRR